MKWDLAKLTPKDRRALADDLRNADSGMYRTAALAAAYKACNAECSEEKLIPWLLAMELENAWGEQGGRSIAPFEDCLRNCELDDFMLIRLRKRMDAILERRWDDNDGFLHGEIAWLFRTLKGKTEVCPDFGALADDFCEWNDEDKHVQRGWVRVVYFRD